jgi:hypothetical protein
MSNGVTATAPDSDDLDHRTLWCTINKFKHDYSPFFNICRSKPASPQTT